MLFFPLLLCFSCTTNKDIDSSEPLPKPVLVEIMLLDAISRDRMNNVHLTSSLDQQTTDNEGQATILVDEEQQITVEATASGYMPHHLELYSGRINYSATSFMASRTAADQVYSLLSPSITVASSKGIIIVALDNPDLSPAIGATASIDSQSDDPFVLTAISANYSNEILPNAAGFVAFPNVTPGETTITVQSPEGSTCVHHSAGATESASITVLADTVHVVFFMCNP